MRKNPETSCLFSLLNNNFMEVISEMFLGLYHTEDFIGDVQGTQWADEVEDW